MSHIWDENLPPIFVCVIYRPPKISFKAEPSFIPTLPDLCSDYSHKIITGDLNADILNNSTDSRLLKKISTVLSL